MTGLAPGVPQPVVVEILDPYTGHLTGFLRACRGLTPVVDFVTTHFQDQENPIQGKRILYRSIYVVRNGQELGSLNEFRQRYALWELIADKRAASKNLKCGSRTLKTPGRKNASFPAIKFKASTLKSTDPQ